MEAFNLLEQAADRLIAMDNVVVIDMISAPGYPQLQVLVRAMMPVFLWIGPDTTHTEAKVAVVKNLDDVGATYFDIATLADLDPLVEAILRVNHPWSNPIDLTFVDKAREGLDALSQGFDRVDAFLD